VRKLLGATSGQRAIEISTVSTILCVGGGLSEGQTRQLHPNLVVLMVELLLLVIG
jgi:hypothetical protein